MKIPASPRELAGCYEVRQALGQSGKDIQPSSARWKPRPDLVNSIGAGPTSITNKDRITIR